MRCKQFHKKVAIAVVAVTIIFSGFNASGTARRTRKANITLGRPKADTNAIGKQGIPVGRAFDALPTYDEAELYRNIRYPQLARRMGIEGLVVLECHVDIAGTIDTLNIMTSAHPTLDSEASRAVRLLTFRPAVRDGKITDSWVRLPVRFSLRAGVETPSTKRLPSPPPPPPSPDDVER